MGLILCEISSPSWKCIEEDRELVLCCVCPGLWLGILRDTLASSKCDSSLLYTQPFCSDICPGALVGRKKVVVLLREGGRENPLTCAWHYRMPYASQQHCVATAVLLQVTPGQRSPCHLTHTTAFLA